MCEIYTHTHTHAYAHNRFTRKRQQKPRKVFVFFASRVVESILTLACSLFRHAYKVITLLCDRLLFHSRALNKLCTLTMYAVFRKYFDLVMETVSEARLGER